MTAPIYARYLEQVRRWMKEHKGFDLSTHLHLLHDLAGGHTEGHIEQVLRSQSMSATVSWPTFLLQILDVSLARIIRSAFLCANLLLSRQRPALEPGLAAARKRQFHILVGMWYPGTSSNKSVSLCVELSETIIATALKVGASASLNGEQDSEVRVLVDGIRVEFKPCRERGLALARAQQRDAPPQSESDVQKTMKRLLQEIDLAYEARQAKKGAKKG